jgi:hypothetical protein
MVLQHIPVNVSLPWLYTDGIYKLVFSIYKITNLVVVIQYFLLSDPLHGQEL